MLTDISHVTILVDGQDEALGLVVRDDDEFEMEGQAGQWLTVSPPGEEFPQIALAEADTPIKRGRVGSKVDGHVDLVFQTEEFDAGYDRLHEAGVEFHGEPMHNPWGTGITSEGRRHQSSHRGPDTLSRQTYLLARRRIQRRGICS
jgi:hypothetical protein